MKSADFWASINTIIDDGFTHDGLQKLDRYAEQFISGELIYQRFSPLEQYGCTKGGETHVIASLLASAKNGTNRAYQGSFPSFKDELECSAQQAQCIEAWSRAVGCWIDNVTDTLTSSNSTRCFGMANSANHLIQRETLSHGITTPHFTHFLGIMR